MKTIYFLVVALGVVLLSATPGFTQQCGDLDGSGEIAATDALLVLGKAVGQPVPDLTCPLTVGVLRTGQTRCYGDTNPSIDCTGTGQDGEFQNGVPRSFTDNGDGTITDNATGLMWEKLSDDETIHDKDNGYSWSEAFDLKVATLNATAFATYTDWRVPNAFELFTLVDYGRGLPKIAQVFDVACEPGCSVLTCSCTEIELDGYWSSTTYAYFSSNHALVAEFFFGGVDASQLKSEPLYVRAVRGGS